MECTILKDLRKVVTTDVISKLAFKHKFTQRSTSQIRAIDFIQMIIFQVSSGIKMTYNALNASLRSINHKICVSNQALAKYLCRASSGNFMKSVYEKIFEFQKSSIILSKLSCEGHKSLDKFNNIYVEDSTYCSLNETLGESFTGCGGSSSKSGLKINVIQEFKSSIIHDFNIIQGNCPDSKHADQILNIAKKGDLVLRDLGYSNLKIFEDFTDKGIYFVSRLHYSINVYDNKTSNTPLELGNFLAKKMKGMNTLNISLYFGARKQKYRMAVYRVPQNVADQRRNKVKRNAVCHGRTATQNQLKLCDYVILITNVPEEMLDTEVIGTIYRIRWSIELLFKSWKSHLKVQLSLGEGTNPSRIVCYIYAILIVGLLVILMQAWLQTIYSCAKEISIAKFTQWIIFVRGVFRALFEKLNQLQEELKACYSIVCYQVRSRKTTRQRVALEESYSSKYIMNF